MKASIYNPYLDTLGGGERYTLSFAKVLSEYGFDVDIQWSDKSILKNLSDRFGINISNNVKIVDDIKRGENYDLCFWVSDGSIPTLKARKNLIHFQVPFEDVNGGSLLNRMKLFRVERIICNSVFTKKIIDREFLVNSTVIYPPVDVKKIKRKKKTNTILYVGRFSSLVQNKNHEILVDCFKKMITDRKFINWKLVIAGGVEIGTGDMIHKLRKKSRNVNIDIITSPNYKTLLSLYGESKIFWSAAGYRSDETKTPQNMEHFGITVVEAMSAGVVPIIFDAGGHKEIIENGKNGFLWKNPDELINITKNIINSHELLGKISKNACLKSQIFSYEEFEKQIESIL